MSTNKVNGSNVQPMPQAVVLPITPVSTTLPTGTDQGYSSQFQGTSFRQGGMATIMRRGPTTRMPLRSPQTKRRKGNRSAPGISDGGNEDVDFSLPHDEDDQEQSRFTRVQGNFQTRGEADDQSDSQHRDEKRRFDNLFAISAFKAVDTVASSSEKSTVTGTRLDVAKSLPPMNSLREVVTFIHSALQSDPTGRSMAVLLRTLNAAVLRGEIKLPAMTKVAEARSLLIEIFGKGYQGKEALPSSVSTVHTMLPLWLINLSKRRTDAGRVQAAARLSLPRTAFITE